MPVTSIRGHPSTEALRERERCQLAARINVPVGATAAAHEHCLWSPLCASLSWLLVKHHMGVQQRPPNAVPVPRISAGVVPARDASTSTCVGRKPICPQHTDGASTQNPAPVHAHASIEQHLAELHIVAQRAEHACISVAGHPTTGAHDARRTVGMDILLDEVGLSGSTLLLGRHLPPCIIQHRHALALALRDDEMRVCHPQWPEKPLLHKLVQALPAHNLADVSKHVCREAVLVGPSWFR
mmetsp:Transcript_1800/g.5724  ORF Transcript_1800/g.5724 Transcript_1800/m.5724 type:complete len:241 (-) Transcript_1800:617-1339(-)